MRAARSAACDPARKRHVRCVAPDCARARRAADLRRDRGVRDPRDDRTAAAPRERADSPPSRTAACARTMGCSSVPSARSSGADGAEGTRPRCATALAFVPGVARTAPGPRQGDHARFDRSRACAATARRSGARHAAACRRCGDDRARDQPGAGRGHPRPASRGASQPFPGSRFASKHGRLASGCAFAQSLTPRLFRHRRTRSAGAPACACASAATAVKFARYLPFG